MNTIFKAGTKIAVGDLISVAEDGCVYPIGVATVSADTSRGMAAELLRDIQQRNYGTAETKARQLWNQLGREAKAMRKARGVIQESLDELERKIHQQRVAAAGQAGREVAARLEARRLAELKQKEPDIFLQEMDSRIQHLDQAQKMQHSELGQGMRTGFMYARAIYKGTQK